MKTTIKIIIVSIAIMSLTPSFAKGPQRVAILGDSYSTFEGEVSPAESAIWYYKEPNYEKTDVDKVEQTWWYKFIKGGNYELAINNSFSGSTICNTGYRGEDFSHMSFIARMNNLNEPDIILIFGATNDSWAGAPLGEYKYSDWSCDELYSFRPAMARLLSYIKEHYPNAEPYFIINDILKDEIVESIESICHHYEIRYIQLNDIDKIDGHPSVKGMEQIYNQVKGLDSGM